MRPRQQDPIGNALGFVAIVIVTAWLVYTYLGTKRQNDERMARRSATRSETLALPDPPLAFPGLQTPPPSQGPPGNTQTGQGAYPSPFSGQSDPSGGLVERRDRSGAFDREREAQRREMAEAELRRFGVGPPAGQ